ncbi:hypothetical protein [Halomonas sp. PA16-9]|uniref:hypothetical protein n=1 Tax=Halomonas sp. PA16-9 TaxID=2576841 RepID=UPI0030EB796D
MEYIFTLKYQLADSDSDLDALVERLGAAGCDDALVGVGSRAAWRWNSLVKRAAPRKRFTVPWLT